MTLTLLLQLTDEEQLYAWSTPQPVVIEAVPAPVEAPALEICIEQKDEQA
jgi:hypothetical protein